MNQPPYVAIDLMTSEVLGRFDSENAAYMSLSGQPITVIYRPTKRKASKVFPYNG